MDKFCLLVAIPCLRAPAKYDRFSVWCIYPGVYLKIRPMSYFHDGNLYDCTEELCHPSPKPGCFWSFFTPPGRTQRRIYDLFFVRVFLICTTVTAKSVTSIIFDQNNISTMSSAPPLQISKVDLYHRATRPLMSFVHGRSYGPDH